MAEPTNTSAASDEEGAVVKGNRAAKRRAAIDQAFRRWHDMGRDERVKLAKAYLIDAVDQHGTDEGTQFSTRLNTGLNLLRESLEKPYRPCSGCRGTGKVAG